MRSAKKKSLWTAPAILNGEKRRERTKKSKDMITTSKYTSAKPNIGRLHWMVKTAP